MRVSQNTPAYVTWGGLAALVGLIITIVFMANGTLDMKLGLLFLLAFLSRMV